MTVKTFVALAVVTLVVALAAAFSASRYYIAQKSPWTDTLLFPGLDEKLNDVAEVKIVHGGGTLTLKRTGQAWTMAEKGDYPVVADKANKTAIRVSQIRIIEAKTRRPDLFARLEVNDVNAEGAKSKLVRLKDSSGGVLAEMIVGKVALAIGGAQFRALYVRKPGENQAWLARSRLDVSESPMDWLVPEIMDVASERVMRVTTEAPDGSPFAVSRSAPGDKNLQMDEVPADVELSDEADVHTTDMSRGLANLEMLGVAQASEFDFSDSKVFRFEVRTFDGLVVRGWQRQKGEWWWAKFEASAGEPAAGKAGPSAEEVANEAAVINARVGGFVYQMPANKARYLRTGLKDLLKKEGNDKSS